jgi:hypothetical protein
MPKSVPRCAVHPGVLQHFLRIFDPKLAGHELGEESVARRGEGLILLFQRVEFFSQRFGELLKGTLACLVGQWYQCFPELVRAHCRISAAFGDGL